MVFCIWICVCVPGMGALRLLLGMWRHDDHGFGWQGPSRSAQLLLSMLLCDLDWMAKGNMYDSWLHCVSPVRFFVYPTCLVWAGH